MVAATLGALMLATSGAARAQETDWASVEIRTVPVSTGVYVLMGRGGNIGLSIGADGAFLIDDQFAPLTEKIRAAVGAVTPEPVRFVLNTHWHGDHTGGNENMGSAGALIVAHDNVRRRMNPADFRNLVGRSNQAPPRALPVVTFSDEINFHWNGEHLHVFHAARAHTDGDAVIVFTRANVVHMGDLFFNGRYPFIDLESGGGAFATGYLGSRARGCPKTRWWRLRRRRRSMLPGARPPNGSCELSIATWRRRELGSWDGRWHGGGRFTCVRQSNV
jgi:glyoxylase-like metal-dependent hydrolase (beta-lactamase superfamily II)